MDGQPEREGGPCAYLCKVDRFRLQVTSNRPSHAVPAGPEQQGTKILGWMGKKKGLGKKGPLLVLINVGGEEWSCLWSRQDGIGLLELKMAQRRHWLATL